MSNSLGINRKGKIGQFFCKHKNAEWYVEHETGFQSLSGERRLKICKDCGKLMGTYFAEYEGMGFK